MGFSISWIAVKGGGKDEVLARLNLVDTCSPDPENRGKLSFAELPSGWFLIYANSFTYASPKRIAAASADALAVGCAIEEHVMFSGARAYRDGSALWWAMHDSEKGRYDLSLGGETPSQTEAIKARLIQQQDEEGGEKADVDFIFDIPTEIAAGVCGFRHDQVPEGGPLAFTELEEILPPKAPGKDVLQRIGALFGRN